MIDKALIEKSVREFIEGTGIFLVAVRVSSSNKITVLADRKEGITIDDCVNIHRMIEKNFDRDSEDYELQVSSPGLEMPFVVMEQYYKNEGRKVSVIDNEGNKFTGILKNVTAGGFDLETEIKLKGKKKETREMPFNFDQVKAVKVVLTIM
ncbi:MAG TPA: ribosome assembly cofactor RimP [Bacteroidales bacterium]|jgi:ribosome maturation factor RimP|nr:ribosome assembly cofactor RimP [Bacteroidales bacterium]